MLKFGRFCGLLSLLMLASCVHKQEEDFESARIFSETFREPEYVYADTPVSLSGVRYCPSAPRCSSDPLLPPQPCEQPLPSYYGDISELIVADSMLLIHPITRAKVLCFEQFGLSMVECVERFRNQGYVLITDIPQFAARYDFLKDGAYPGRKWRKGEHVPRF